MAYTDFQDFLRFLESKGDLRRVKAEVSPYLEITELADRMVKAGGPALLFENIVGPPHRCGTSNPRSAVLGQPSIHPAARPEGSKTYDIPVAINTMASRQRMAYALSCDDFEDHAERIRKLLSLPGNVPKSWGDKFKLGLELMGELKNVAPNTARTALCQEVVQTGDEVDLTQFPILTCWPEDGGPYVTLPLVFTHDPLTGKRNVGMYRVQLYDRNTCGMHWQIHKTGMRQMEDAATLGKRRFEVAVVLGGDPAYTFSAISPLPPGIDEMLFAGFLRRKNVELVPCKTIDVQVPADAEIVLEGYVDPQERRLEGPFGDHTGYYSLAEDFPVFHCTAVTMRKNPVWPATIVGVPPMEDGWMGKAVERIFLPMIQLTVPEILDMHLPVEACFHNMAFVRIRKKYAGHAYKVMNAVWGLGQLAFTKMVFIFDEDCNVQDLGEVLFRLGANCDPGRDVLLSRGPLDQLDHSAQQEGFGGKIGFDCTHKWPGENGFTRDFPKLIAMSDDVKARVEAIWNEIRT